MGDHGGTWGTVAEVQVNCGATAEGEAAGGQGGEPRWKNAIII
jgi:hypothetical protein